MKQSQSSAKRERSARDADTTGRLGSVHRFPNGPHPADIPLIPTLEKLAAATKTPVCVQPNTPVDEAIALMLLHDYSQLPVLSGESTVKGMVSWRSIGKAFAINRTGTDVRDFTEPRPKIRELSTPLVDAVADVIKHEVILVRDQAKRIVGLVTSTDLSVLLKDVAEAFLRIGEIEHYLRRLVAVHCSLDELRTTASRETGRVINGPGDLTFGEYIRLLQDPKRWARLKVRIAQGPAITRLEAVRKIRNHVMHFGEGELTVADRQVLSGTARFVATLASSVRDTHAKLKTAGA